MVRDRIESPGPFVPSPTMAAMLTDPMLLARLLVCAFFAVLFLQSGLDKITDWSGNLEWLTGHFAQSPVKGMVPLLLGVVTALEVSTGLASASALIALLTGALPFLPVVACGLAGVTLVVLFAGQRIAKDYAGAATLAAYFAVAVLGLFAARSL
jgi:uncharacterized membrane protein YphA (DoxX/SURF4 family)